MLIFINYKQNTEPDHRIAMAIEKGLLNSGFKVFRDETILRGGDEWPQMILDHLKQCDTMISLISNESMKSRWVINEIDEAIQQKNI